MTCRVAIIGLGMVARLHIQAVNSLSGFQVYGLFSRDESKTQEFAEKYAKGAKIGTAFKKEYGIGAVAKIDDLIQKLLHS